jgi:hypothetical protein
VKAIHFLLNTLKTQKWKEQDWSRKCPDLIEELACEILVGCSKITVLISLGKFLFEIRRKLEYLAKKIGGEAEMAVLCYIQCSNVIGKAIFGFGYWQITLHGLLTAKTGVTRRIPCILYDLMLCL